MNDAVPKEVLNPEQATKRYDFRTYLPSEQLASFVDYYWIMRWDLRDKAPFMAEVIPSPYTNLTFMPEGARVTGVTTGKYTYELSGAGSIVGVKFKPGGLHPFYAKSLHELTNTFVPASTLFPEADAAFNDLILTLSDKEAVARVEKLLCAKSPSVDKNLELVANALKFLETASQPSLSSAVDYSGLSERRLQEIFREYIGVGVKWIILRARLIKGAELAATLHSPNWTVIAHDLGYGDQSHFINDFKRIIGKTPVQYAAEVKNMRHSQ